MQRLVIYREMIVCSLPGLSPNIYSMESHMYVQSFAILRYEQALCTQFILVRSPFHPMFYTANASKVLLFIATKQLAIMRFTNSTTITVLILSYDMI